MSARSRKRSQSKDGTPRFNTLKESMSVRRLLVAATGTGLVLGLAGYLLWDNAEPESGDITIDQLDRDFQGIGLGALGVSESARLPDPGEATDDPNSVSWQPQSDASAFEFAVAENDPADETANGPSVIYPEATASAGPLFPNPLSVPSIQPTQYSGPSLNPAATTNAPSGPAWLTGGIEFVGDQ